MTTPPTDPEIEQQRRAKSDRYLLLSQRLLKHAQQQLERGDTVQASEKTYGAVSHAVKSYGELRGWNHSNHHRVGLILDQLSDEESDITLTTDFGIVESLHNNFFEYVMPTNRVRGSINVAMRLIDRLESLRNSEPRPLLSSAMNREQRRRLTLLMQPPAQNQATVEELPSLEDLPE